MPVLGPQQAILKIRRIGICGTDLHAFEGRQPFFSYPRIMGHELAADLVEADEAPGFVPGEAVTILPYISCGHCVACRTGKPNCCIQIRVCGVHTDGGMAEYYSVPADTLVHGEGLQYDELALVEPLAIGAHAVRRSAVRRGEFVLVVGAGPIGLATMVFASIAGAVVIALDLVEKRVAFCTRQLQMPFALCGKGQVIHDALLKITGGDMPSVVFDCTGNLAAIKEAFSFLSYGGQMVLVGLQGGEIAFSHPEFHKREATLMSSRNATREDFQQVMASIRQGLVKPRQFITHRCEFRQAAGNFNGWLDPSTGLIKAMVFFGEP